MSITFLAFEVVSLDGNNSLDANFSFFLLCVSLHGRGPGRQLQNQKGLQRHQKEWPQSCLRRVPHANSQKKKDITGTKSPASGGVEEEVGAPEGLEAVSRQKKKGITGTGRQLQAELKRR